MDKNMHLCSCKNQKNPAQIHSFWKLDKRQYVIITVFVAPMMDDKDGEVFPRAIWEIEMVHL